MPFILEDERYEIVDYNAMLVYMMQFPIFESPDKRLEYFSRWINHLKAIDDAMAREKLVIQSLQCFSFRISFDAVHVRIQFNIDAISKLVEDEQASAVPLKSFGPKQGQINYTSVADGEFDRVTEPPTILVEKGSSLTGTTALQVLWQVTWSQLTSNTWGTRSYLDTLRPLSLPGTMPSIRLSMKRWFYTAVWKMVG